MYFSFETIVLHAYIVVKDVVCLSIDGSTQRCQTVTNGSGGYILHAFSCLGGYLRKLLSALSSLEDCSDQHQHNWLHF